MGLQSAQSRQDGFVSGKSGKPDRHGYGSRRFHNARALHKRPLWVVDGKFRRRSPRATASNLQRECNSKHAACLLIATVISVSDAGCVCGSGGGGGAGNSPRVVPGVGVRGGGGRSPVI